MPLNEISPNVPRAGPVRTSTSPHKAIAIPKTASSLASDAVQSMLRTSTETGEIGHFSFRPSRLPRSASRVLPTSRGPSSFDAPYGASPRERMSIPAVNGYRKHIGPKQMEPFYGLSRQDTIHSNLTSYRHNPRSRLRNVRPFPPGMSRGLKVHDSRRLHSHRSLTTPRSQRDFSSVRSSSPMMYSASSGRPHYGPATQTHYNGYWPGPRFNRDPSIGTAASSPVSIFRRQQGPPGSCYDLNNSVSFFTRLPSPAVQPSQFGARRSPFPSRTSTPMSSVQIQAASSSLRAESINGLARSPTGSTIPMYYDYTEPFAEEDCFSVDHNMSMSSLPFNIDRTILENEPAPLLRRAQTPFGTVPGSAFHPSELPVTHSRTASEQSSGSVAKPIPGRKSSLAVSRGVESKIAIPEEAHQVTNEVNAISLRADGEYNHVSRACKRSDASTGLPRDDENPSELVAAHQGLQNACPASPDSLRSSSSKSMCFFANASRSPRDLTSLAARVHSSELVKTVPKAANLYFSIDNHKAPASSTTLNTVSWQLPSITFRPLSIGSERDVSAGRLLLTTELSKINVPEIVSPIPERPVSSQSRRRFSKILGIDEDHPVVVTSMSRSYHSLNLGKLRQVAEVPESLDSLRLSLRPCSPRKSISDAGTSLTDNRSSINTSHEKSTVESLLDRHIECLGLTPDSHGSKARELTAALDQKAELTASGTESTVKLSDLAHNREKVVRPSSNTTSSDCPSSLASPDRKCLMPRRLFSSDEVGIPRLASARSMPSMYRVASESEMGRRSSIGWVTLPSTTPLLFSQVILEQVPESPRGDNSSLNTALQQACEDSQGDRCSTVSSSSRSHERADLYNWDDNLAERNPKDLDMLARHASQRRKMKLRIKMRKAYRQSKLEEQNILSVSDLCGSDLSSAQGEPGPTREVSTDNRQIAPVVRHESPPSPVMLTITSVREGDQNPLPNIPHRWSSIVAVAPEVVRPSMDISRKLSVRTVQSYRTETSLAEPLNSTRLSLQAPRLDTLAPRLGIPDLGPSLHSLNLDLNVSFPSSTANNRPILREARSFFSDDSSAVHHQRASLRKRFHLHSLRNVLPSSPRAPAGLPDPDLTPRKSPTSPRNQSLDAEERERDLYGTVGMSEFAYRKRKIVDRLRDWWKRHSMQRKLGLKRKKSQKSQKSVAGRSVLPI